MATRIGMVSLGCSKNQVDAEKMLYKLKSSGFEIIEDAGLADIVIINRITKLNTLLIDNLIFFVGLLIDSHTKKTK